MKEARPRKPLSPPAGRGEETRPSFPIPILKKPAPPQPRAVKPLPRGTPDAAHSRQHQIATSANAIYDVVLKGKDLPLAMDGCSKLAHGLGDAIGPILDCLRGFGD